MKLKSSVTVNIQGVNLDRLIKQLSKLFLIKNITRISHKEVEIDIGVENLKRLFANVDRLCYTIRVKKYNGLAKIFRKDFFILGYGLALILLLILFSFLSQFTFKIDIYGLDKIDSQLVYSVLEQQNIKVGSKKLVNYDEIEKILKQEIEDISMISIAQKGNALIINIKEKISFNLQSISSDIVAEFDGIIEEMICYGGTPLKKVGDTFKKGDVIVKGEFLTVNGEKVEIKANAEILARKIIKKELTILNEEIKKIRTGNSVKIQNLKLFDKISKIKKQEISFKNYEIETIEKFLFLNNFLPLKLKIDTYYEIEYYKIENNFEENRQKFIDENELSLKQDLKNKEILEIVTKVRKIDEGNIIVSFAQILEKI